MKCQNCGFDGLNEKAKFCPKCGSPITQKPVETVPMTAPASSGEFLHDISKIWPEWRIEKQLGKGSYGVVYQVVRDDNNVTSHAAVKVISIPSDSSEVDTLRSEGIDLDGTRTYFKGIVDDFVSEIILMESLKGIQNIVSVEDYKVIEKTDSIGWNIYIRMELLTPFNTYTCDKKLAERDVIKLGCDICSALEICGQRNIIHRDIKPENIFINDFGHFKLGDFGIARKLENMTGGLSQKGTFNYMAPEVANSSEYDAKVDTYSLGIVLYRLLNNNRLPFINTDKQLLNPNERKNAVDRRIRGEALPAPCNASPEMADVILRACAYDPKVRFPSATAMKQALMSVANGTYVVSGSFDNYDKTTAISHSNNELDKTTAFVGGGYSGAANVSYGSNNPLNNQYNQPVNTFGNKQEKAKKKVSKVKVTFIAILVVIIGLAVGLVALFFNSSAYSATKDMKKENYSDALSKYERNIKDNFIEETILGITLKDYASTIVTDYKNGEIDYDTAVEGLEALKEMGLEGIDDKIAEITTANTSANALEAADQYYSDGNYEAAIQEYAKIPESDENYNKAQEKLNEICPIYIDQIVDTATQYQQSKNYSAAVKHINTAYDILPDYIDTADLDSLKTTCLSDYKSYITNEVTTLINANEYMKAITLINDAIAVDNNEDFQSIKASAISKYVDYTTALVNEHIANEDYISAQRVADTASANLPDNIEFKELVTKVKKETPVYLLDVCKPYESNDYKEYVNGETVTMAGRAYTNAFSFHSHDYASRYAIFNVGKNYSTLGFTLGHIDGTDMRNGHIKIYCDGILKKEYTLGADSLPQRYSLDITGVSQIKVVLEEADWAGYAFANVTVK